MSNNKPESEASTPEAADMGSEQSTNEANTGIEAEIGSELTLEQALEKLAAQEEQVDRAKDDLLRVQAEMQNLRRRTEQDVEKAHKYGQERLITELLTARRPSLWLIPPP